MMRYTVYRECSQYIWQIAELIRNGWFGEFIHSAIRVIIISKIWFDKPWTIHQICHETFLLYGSLQCVNETLKLKIEVRISLYT